MRELSGRGDQVTEVELDGTAAPRLQKCGATRSGGGEQQRAVAVELDLESGPAGQHARPGRASVRREVSAPCGQPAGFSGWAWVCSVQYSPAQSEGSGGKRWPFTSVLQ